MPTTRRLQTFRLERRTAILPPALRDLIIKTHQHNQADVLVSATTKAAALARLRELGFYNSMGHLRVAHGDDLEALRAAGVLANFGDVVAFREGNRGDPVALVPCHTSAPHIVGNFELDAATRRTVFVHAKES